MKRALSRRSGLALALGILTLGMAFGCVERETLEPDPIPLWNRYDAEQRRAKVHDFVLHSIEIGGRIECKGNRFNEQTTEVYARTLLKHDNSEARVKQLFVRFEYLKGVLKGARATDHVYRSDRAQVKERRRVELNPGGECTCVRVVGIMWIMNRNRTVTRIICPEDA